MDPSMVGAGTASRRGRRIGAAIASLALVSLAGVTGSNAWVERASRGYVYDSADAVPGRDVAIVPGSRVFRGQPLRILRDRLEAALALYQAGRVKAILVSGDDNATSPEVTIMAAWLRAHGVPASDVWSDGGGSRTRETMTRAAALYGITGGVVCTQTVNMARSIYLARAAGIDAVGLALPTNLGQSKKYLARESLKTTLAFAEAQLRARPTPAALSPIVATR
jgi:vancomycin permeability regulator SanA